MRLKKFLTRFSVVAMVALPLPGGRLHAEGGQPGTRPNILLFLVDDLGARDLGCEGSAYYETPAVDSLASEGMRFTQAYAAHPRCVPSRFAALTGKYPARAGVPGGGNEEMGATEKTIAESLKEGGYHTFYAGKWHLGHDQSGHPTNQGFDESVAAGSAGAAGSHWFPYNKSGGKKAAKGGGEEAPLEGLDEGVQGEYLADRLTDETVKFLRAHASGHKDQPFFAVLAHYAVHTPIEGKPHLVEKFDNKAKAGPVSGPEFIEKDGITKVRQDNAHYAAMVASVDESVGRILATLDELGLSDQTIVVFTSDHGGLSNRGASNQRELATSNLPLRAGKGHLYEGGIRVPLIVKWPSVTPKGVRSDSVVTNTDLYPTFLEMAGLPPSPEHHLDGRSFVRSLRGNPAVDRGPIFWHSPRPRPNSTGDLAASAVRSGDFKYVMHYGEAEDGLYNLAADPGEENNLLHEAPAKAAELRALLEGWLADVKAVPPRPTKK